MALSLIVLLIPVAVIVGLFRLRGGEDVVTVDPAPAIAQAQAANVVPITVPHGLSGQWRTVTAVYASGTLRVGYVTPSGGGVQVIESNEPEQSLLDRELGGDQRLLGEVRVGGASWRSLQVRGDERALVLTEPRRTLVVVGHADLAELRTLAAAVS